MAATRALGVLWRVMCSQRQRARTRRDVLHLSLDVDAHDSDERGHCCWISSLSLRCSVSRSPGRLTSPSDAALGRPSARVARLVTTGPGLFLTAVVREPRAAGEVQRHALRAGISPSDCGLARCSTSAVRRMSDRRLLSPLSAGLAGGWIGGSPRWGSAITTPAPLRLPPTRTVPRRCGLGPGALCQFATRPCQVPTPIGARCRSRQLCVAMGRSWLRMRIRRGASGGAARAWLAT